MLNKIKVIAFYHFFKPDYDLEIMRMTLRLRMSELEIKGSILLAPEGINGTISGLPKQMDSFIQFLHDKTHFKPALKISYCESNPFKRSLVKIKPSIVCEPGQQPINLNRYPAPYISPEELNQWIESGQNMIILDTRNDYEYQEGHFKGSLHAGTHHFSDFEKNIEKLPSDWKKTPIVTFCTGGIRCEKAAPLLIQKGFEKVYQLEGGILNYFEKIGQGYFEGNCFVFDERGSLDDNLEPVPKEHG